MPVGKKTKRPRMVTKINKGVVKMSRKDWEWFVAETKKTIGVELHDLDPGKGPISMSLDAWLFLLSVIEAALDYSGYAVRSLGCQECCDDICSPFGGCDFCFGSAAICVQGDLFACT